MPLEVRNIVIGEGLPKICIPLTGVTQEEIIEEGRAALQLPCQLIEWRADFFLMQLQKEGCGTLQKIGERILPVLFQLREILPIPIIVTIRTKSEGGEAELSKREYFKLNGLIAQSQKADFVDIQAFEAPGVIDEKKIKAFVDFAHRNKTRVLLSNHDFQATPDIEEMLTRFFAMEALGGDMVKLAVMPHSEEDVLALLEACALMRDSETDVPVIAVSMGELGMSSRICGGEFGSSITFASGKEASAPGQIDAIALENFIKQYY